jgi:hypothetical protein
VHDSTRSPAGEIEPDVLEMERRHVEEVADDLVEVSQQGVVVERRDVDPLQSQVPRDHSRPLGADPKADLVTPRALIERLVRVLHELGKAR